MKRSNVRILLKSVKAPFEAASRVMKLGELDAARARSLPIKDARTISQVALLNTKGTINSRSAESSGATPLAIDTIADEEEDVKTKTSSFHHSK
jgi:hypothetical protein